MGLYRRRRQRAVRAARCARGEDVVDQLPRPKRLWRQRLLVGVRNSGNFVELPSRTSSKVPRVERPTVAMPCCGADACVSRPCASLRGEILEFLLDAPQFGRSGPIISEPLELENVSESADDGIA